MKRTELKRKSPIKRKPTRKVGTAKSLTWYKKQCDILFSRKVRSVGYCEKCGSTETLQCSHVFSRTILSLRFDPENAISLCYKCHIAGPESWHHNPLDSARWFESKWPGRYDRLLERRNKGGKIDVKAMYEYLKQ